MVPVIKQKKYVTSTGVFRIIVSKFSYKKKSNLVILLIIDKNVEVGCQNTVLSLNLAIGLQVKGS